MRVPHDQDAEECVIGASLLSPGAAAWALDWLSPADFYKPSLSHAFSAILDLYRSGGRIDAVTCAEAVRRLGFDSPTLADLVHLQAATPAISSISRYGEIVARHALCRQALALVTEATEKLQNATVEPAEYLEQLASQLRCIDSPILVRDPGDMGLGQLLDEPLEERTPWVIPGLLRLDWRATFIGVEGGGRSTLLRQLAICAAHGVHPFTNAKYVPQRSLIIDLENPRMHLQDWGGRIHERCASRTGSDAARDRCRVWHRMEGIDLRKRTHRAELEDILRRHRPTLVAIGPLYKSFFRTSAESFEEPASQMQAIFDDLRARYGFALVIEHHAPHASHGFRDLRPEGSSLWLRWGELRFKLVPVLDQAPYTQPSDKLPMRAARRGGYSGDRMFGEHAWPDALYWGDPRLGQLPWCGYWDDPVEERL